MKSISRRRSLVARLVFVEMVVVVVVCVIALLVAHDQLVTQLDRGLVQTASSLMMQLPTVGLSESQLTPDDVDAFLSPRQNKAKDTTWVVGSNLAPYWIYQLFDSFGRLRARSTPAPETALVPYDIRAPHEVPMPDRSARSPEDNARVRPQQAADPVSPNALVLPSNPTTALNPWCSEVRMADAVVEGKRWHAVAIRSASCDVLIVAQSADDRSDMVALGMAPLLRYMAWLLPVSLVIAWLIARHAMSPLQRVAGAIANREPQDLRRLDMRDTDFVEIAPLTEEINRLLMELSGLLASERAGFADAAHELLTPLAVVQAHSHLLATAGDATARVEAAEGLQLGVRRVSMLIRQLLTLVRFSGTDSELRRVQVDLAGLLRERVGTFAGVALAKSIDLSLESPERCMCLLDVDGISVAVDNLLDNAIRYTNVGGEVLVCLQETMQDILLSVADDGPGVPGQYMERVVDRFFRVPGMTEPGNGLGLAIVVCAIRAHRGSIVLKSGLHGQGLGVHINLPCQSHASDNDQ